MPLTYTFDSTAKVHVYAYMIGIRFQISVSQWYPCPLVLDEHGDPVLDECCFWPDGYLRECRNCEPYQMDSSEVIWVENTGGVTLDFDLNYRRYMTTWTISDTCGFDEFYLGVLCGSPYDVGDPPLISHFLFPNRMANAPPLFPVLQEIDQNHFYNPSWSVLPSMRPSGIRIPAEEPGDPLGDTFIMYFYFITPLDASEAPICPPGTHCETISIILWARMTD
ncbi:hypothetical protein JW877_07670 [bacterium]|nr:hypothetical protein [bacterium]